jgi:YegS/Rv2252/BmrU family lipid kinase
MWKIIINPTAGSGKAKKRKGEILAKLKAANIPHEVAMTERQGHATELCKTAIEQGFRQIIVVGGDGSNHEVMNGIMKQTVVPTHDITQCLIPVGTGNDWIRTHQLPRNVDKIIQNIKGGKTQLQDIGKATFLKNGVLTERYFMNVAGLAYDAFIAKKSNENPNFVSNKIFYLYLILSSLFQYEPQKTRITFQKENKKHFFENKYYTINIGICKYSGGGMQFVPHAIPNDGLFALTTVESMSIPGVFAATPYLYGGRISKHRKSFLTQTDYVKVESLDDEAVMLELDGEFVGVSPIEFEVITGAFRFVV